MLKTIGAYLFCLACGAVIGTFVICRDCEGGDAVPPPPTYIQAADISEMRDAYTAYMQQNPTSGESGFSLNKELILDLSGHFSPSSNIAGFRLYPGILNSQNKIIVIPFYNDGGILREDGASLIKGFFRNPSALSGSQGPCPNWCDNNSRVIQ